MKGLKYRSTLWILSLSLTFPFAVLAQDSTHKKGEKAEAGPMVIKSDSLEVDNNRRIVTFTGNVNCKRDDLLIESQKLLVYYRNQPTKQASEKEKVEVDKIIATGQVRITQPDGSIATAERAVYYQNDEKVVLSGNPVVKQGNNFVEGSTITLFLKEKRSIVESSKDRRVKAVIFPKKEKK
ncbi:MAG: lipopolysaccharide transport periplasmic protein LptA [Desulfatiglandales bacterium]